ncbi:MAG: diguanylate cyclase [Pseudomonadales bacterium]|nr:diguanylate cyclase [Pseudomonadales bacterium]
MNKFLLVEDSALVVKVINHLLKTSTDLAAEVATSKKQAIEMLRTAKRSEYVAAVVDLHLPDAPDGEVVDLTLKLGLPTIVLTGSLNEHTRDQMIDKPIVDYIVKESRFSYEYVLKLLRRLLKNKEIEVLVVDDSVTSRTYLKQLLNNQQLRVHEASDGTEAIALLQQNPNIQLLITDYHMPNMNGIELVKNIRQNTTFDDLVIIGISSHDTNGLSAQFIKNGANDFLTKPFSNEEFHCRVIHNLEALENIRKIKQAAHTDYLTNLPNRRYFQSKATEILDQHKSKPGICTLAIIDIDHFKRINDQYGHDVGDQVLIEFSNLLAQGFQRFTFARAGGEEFYLLLPGLRTEQAIKLIENFREMIEDHLILLEQDSLTITFSAGLAGFNGESLTDLMRIADTRLYSAKNSGRNQLCWED